jgi:hypothetical protein
MATATSKSLGALLLLVAVFALASCGGGGGGASRPSELAFMHPTSVPAGWSVAQLPSRIATMAYPGTWRRITSDPGTISAAQLDARGVIVGYLNATPQQADESLSNWASFRPYHNADEGDRHVRVLAAARALRFGSARASCVIDTYSTSRAPYARSPASSRGHATRR